jgi:hypothetical protein
MSGSCPFCGNSHNFVLNDDCNKFKCKKCNKILKYSPTYFKMQHMPYTVCVDILNNPKCPKCNVYNAAPFQEHKSICLLCKNTFSICNLKQVKEEYSDNEKFLSQKIVEVK